MKGWLPGDPGAGPFFFLGGRMKANCLPTNLTDQRTSDRSGLLHGQSGIVSAVLLRLLKSGCFAALTTGVAYILLLLISFAALLVAARNSNSSGIGAIAVGGPWFTIGIVIIFFSAFWYFWKRV
jgi:hypothetical protein